MDFCCVRILNNNTVVLTKLKSNKIRSSYVGFSLVMSTLTLFRAFLAPVGAGAAAGAGLV